MNCVISGSFRKHYKEICEVIVDFEKMGVRVASPKKSSITNPGEAFAFLESDTTHDAKLLEENHLDAIRHCDFLYVCDLEGYTGASTLLEIGFAKALGKKIYCREQPSDPVIGGFINGIGTPKEIIHIHASA